MTYEKKVNIGYSTIGKQGVLKIVSIMNFLQDTASEHAALMGVSGFDLAKENLGWVIFRYHIEIMNNPAWQDEIAIRTDRFSCKNLYEIRNLTITMADNGAMVDGVQLNKNRGQTRLTDGILKRGETLDKKNQEKPLVNARVCWVMVNRQNGRPVRLSRFMDKEFTHNGGLLKKEKCNNNKALQDNSIQNNEGLESYFQDIIKPENIHYQLPFKVRMHDLDLNGHVNNAIFVEWGVETVPEEILSRFSPASIDVIFNKESLYGDSIVSQTEIGEDFGMPVTFHSIIRQQDQIELARLNICWHPLANMASPFSI